MKIKVHLDEARKNRLLIIFARELRLAHGRECECTVCKMVISFLDAFVDMEES